MPYRCSAVGCRGNYDNDPRVSVFKFPKHPDVRKKWIQFIKRDAFEVTKNSRLCEQHFNPDDIIHETVHYNEKDGTSVKVPLPAPKLREGAIPSYLPGCPEYFSKQSSSREAPDDKRLRLEMQNLEDAIQQSIECKSSYDEERLCKSFDDFQSKINLISIPKGWTVTSDSTRVMFLSIEFNPAPVIHKCIIVDSSMQLTVYYRNVVLSKVKQFIFPFLLQNVNDATEILQDVEFLNQNVETNSCKSAFNVISDSVALLKTLLPSANENLDFILSQLSL